MPTKRKRKRKDEIFEKLRPHFGLAITRLRGPMKRAELARKAGMDAGTLSRLENGKAPFREDYVEGIVRTLEITLPDFLRNVADCCAEAEKKKRPYSQMPAEELLDRLRKIQVERARLKLEASEIKREVKRRQISSVDPSNEVELS